MEVNLAHYVWYEKYRPHSIDDLVLSDNMRERFNAYINDGEFPHLLLVGPPGSGKTTISLILIEAVGAVALSLNASSEDRGIETIRGKVKQFAASQTTDNQLKVVFLDESDQLTQDAQKALRNTIEAYAATCRFILTANYGDKILAPIKSRCTEFHFESLPKNLTFKLCRHILACENVQYNRDDLLKVVDRYYPDIRTIVNNIQAASLGGQLDLSLIGTNVQIDLALIGQHVQNGLITKARQLWAGVSDFVFLYEYLFNTWVAAQFLDEDRTSAALILAEYLYRDSTVLDREINFTACMLELIKEVCKKEPKWK